MIAFDNVTKSYGNNIGIQDVSVKIGKGDFVFFGWTKRSGQVNFY